MVFPACLHVRHCGGPGGDEAGISEGFRGIEGVLSQIPGETGTPPVQGRGLERH